MSRPGDAVAHPGFRFEVVDNEPTQLWLPFPGVPQPILVTPEIAGHLSTLRPRRRGHINRAVADVIGLQRRGLTLVQALAAVGERSELGLDEMKLLRRKVGRVQHAVTRP